MDGAGGLGAVSFGLGEGFLLLLVAAVVLFGLWKLAKIIWAAFAGGA